MSTAPASLVARLLAELDAIPLVDPHSHIDPLQPTSRSLEDILGYHYYTELAHSAGLPKRDLAPEVPARERCRHILNFLERFDNTAQAEWLLDIARTFLGFAGERITAADTDALFDAAQRVFQQPDWEAQVLAQTRLEKIFLTNEFDDPLQGFDTSRYVPCLRTDTLVFHWHRPGTRDRLARATGIQVEDSASLKRALHQLFVHFTTRGPRACQISLPPDFTPVMHSPTEWNAIFDRRPDDSETQDPQIQAQVATAMFQCLAQLCREFGLPFGLMIGVNRQVYLGGVYQGQDLYDRRTSLIQYRDLFNQFPEVIFPISVLTSGQNQELVSYSWIFPNVITNGHWWYSNIPTYIERDLRERLQAVPKTKQIGYYSDAYKLEFVKPKFAMYRRILAGVLAEDFVVPGRLSETQAVALGRRLLRDNVLEWFQV